MGKRDSLLADLHVHSCFSDGDMTPEALAAHAAGKGIGTLAVADHNELAGSEQIAEPLRKRGIGYIPAVEGDCVYQGNLYHVLAYGADFQNTAFRGMVRENREKLDRMSDDLIRAMEKDHPQVSLEGFHAFERDPLAGGWKGIEYLWRAGVTGSLREGIPLYARYGICYQKTGFPNVGEWVRIIRAAGGFSVLAHPSRSIHSDKPDAFSALLEEIADQGIDGVECYYPDHSERIRDICLNFCEARGLMITCGSDFHGTFQRGEIGEGCLPLKKLRLNGLVAREGAPKADNGEEGVETRD